MNRYLLFALVAFAVTVESYDRNDGGRAIDHHARPTAGDDGSAEDDTRSGGLSTRWPLVQPYQYNATAKSATFLDVLWDKHNNEWTDEEKTSNVGRIRQVEAFILTPGYEDVTADRKFTWIVHYLAGYGSSAVVNAVVLPSWGGTVQQFLDCGDDCGGC